MSKLSTLKQLMQDQNVKSDPYWKSILHSDIRNIFPKHQLCKIQALKAQITKVRLIQENLSSILALQPQHNHLSKQHQQSLFSELTAIQISMNQPKDDNEHEYHLEILSKKKDVQAICGELSKSQEGMKPDIWREIIKYPKWKHYLETHIKQPNPIDPSLQRSFQHTQLIQTSNLNHAQALLNPSSTTLIHRKIKNQELKVKLKKFIINSSAHQADSQDREWQQILTDLQQPDL